MDNITWFDQKPSHEPLPPDLAELRENMLAGWAEVDALADMAFDGTLTDREAMKVAQERAIQSDRAYHAAWLRWQDEIGAVLDEMELHECACNGATIDKPGCTCGRKSDPDAELPY